MDGLASLAIRAGVVRSVTPHPEADRLYVLSVDLGEARPRTIVAGMRAHYRPEELEGRHITVLANLAPRTIRRITSQGMVLAAEAGETVALLAPGDEVAAGTLIEGTDPAAPTITAEDLARTPLVVGRVEKTEGAGVLVDIGGRQVGAEGAWPPGSMVIVRLNGPDAANGTILSFGPGRPIRASADMPPGAHVR